MPQQRPDGSFHPGVTDAKMGNTDQVLVYIENHRNGNWGMREDHTRRTVALLTRRRIGLLPNSPCSKMAPR